MWTIREKKKNQRRDGKEERIAKGSREIEGWNTWSIAGKMLTRGPCIKDGSTTINPVPDKMLSMR